MAQYSIIIGSESHNTRLDLALVQSNLELSRRKIRAAIDAGGVFVNRKRVRVASRVVQAGDKVTLEYDPRVSAKLKTAEGFQLEASHVISLNDDLVVVNKPAGIDTQASRIQSVFHMEALTSAYLKSLGIPKAPRLVHRLDRDTSGVLLMALSAKMAEHCEAQFRTRKVEKIYNALSLGVSHHRSFLCNEPLLPPDRMGQVWTHPQGKHAETFVEVEQTFLPMRVSLLRCFPKTGRTHQIRVHLARANLPIWGDQRYGSVPVASLHPLLQEFRVDTHLLHAQALKISLPYGGLHQFEAPLSNMFKRALDHLEQLQSLHDLDHSNNEVYHANASRGKLERL